MTASKPPQDIDLFAAEYAMGVLAASDHALAAELMRKDPAFAARVAAWQRQLAAPDDMPPAPNLPSNGPRHIAQGWRKFALTGRWGQILISALGTAVMAALSVGLLAALLHFSNRSGDAVQMATLTSTQFAHRFDARLDGGILTITQTAGPAAPAGSSYALWLVGGDTPPQPLGQISKRLSLALPSANRGDALVVTQQTFGAGATMGPMIASGILRAR